MAKHRAVTVGDVVNVRVPRAQATGVMWTVRTLRITERLTATCFGGVNDEDVWDTKPYLFHEHQIRDMENRKEG